MFQEMEDYFWKMSVRNRLLKIETEDGLTGLCTFFVLDSELEIPFFYDRICWTTPADHAEGTILYIDKILARAFTPVLQTEIERVLTDRFPLWEMAVWYRPGQNADRCYTYHRRPHGAEVHG